MGRLFARLHNTLTDAPGPANPYLEQLRTRAAEAEHVLARTDQVNAVLAALATALLVAGAAGVGVTGSDAALPAAAQGIMSLALVGVGAALCMLVAAILPRKGYADRPLSGVPLYARLNRDELVNAVQSESPEEYYLERILTVSRIAASKHQRQRIAIGLMLTAVAVLMGAILLSTLG